SSQACIKCPVGSYNPLTGQSTCSKCFPGSYCDTIGATSGKSCPAGTYNPNEGSVSSQACIKCPVGTHYPFTDGSVYFPGW
ncbi:unnamed protein product, partial [Rotaria magnacalcarata]